MESTDIRIVELHPAYLDECVEIMAGSDPWITLAFTRNRARAFFKRHISLGQCFLSLQDGKVTGFIVFYVKEAFPLGGYVKAIGVHVRHRRQGIGRRLMRFAESRILKQWPNVFLLVSDFNTDAQSFYEKLGYSKIGRISDALVRGHAELIYRKTIGPCEGFASSS